VSNLELLSNSAHAKTHGSKKTTRVVKLACPECGKTFYRARRQTHLVKPSKLKATFCSNRCRGLFSSRIQYYGMTEKDAASLRNCILDEMVVESKDLARLGLQVST
jgi:hypothetical protein